MSRFDGKRVIVTGAASGIGASIARSFANEGARVLVADLNYAGAKALADEPPRAMPFEIDVSDEDQTRAMVEAALKSSGGIDIVCPNAGVPHLVSSLVDLPSEDFDRMFAINTKSVYLAAKY